MRIGGVKTRFIDIIVMADERKVIRLDMFDLIRKELKAKMEDVRKLAEEEKVEIQLVEEL